MIMGIPRVVKFTETKQFPEEGGGGKKGVSGDDGDHGTAM